MDPQQNNSQQNNQPTSSQMNASAGSNDTLMGVLAYLGPLVIIPYLTDKNNAAVKFHVKQGVVLLGIEIVVWILARIVWMFYPIWDIANLATLVLAIIGIINVVQGKQKELPLIGSWGTGLNI